MKLKLTVLGVCFLTTNVQCATAHAQVAVAATTGSAVAAMGVGTFAQETPPVVRVDSGQLQGVVDDVGLWVEQFSPGNPTKPLHDENFFNEKPTIQPPYTVQLLSGVLNPRPQLSRL